MRLETERLILREPKISDWKDLVEGLNNREIAIYMNVPFPYKQKNAFEWINKKIKESKEKDKQGHSFVIELKSEKKVIGGMSIESIRKIDKTAKTGSWISKKYQRRGYMTEAKIAANEFAFNKLKLRKLKSGVVTLNKASNATQRAIGYKLEGVLKKELIGRADKKIYDSNLYGLLKEDWEKNLPKLKKHLKNKIKKLKEEEMKK